MADVGDDMVKCDISLTDDLASIKFNILVQIMVSTVNRQQYDIEWQYYNIIE